MPLVKREIVPVFLSRGLVTPTGVTNELECVTNSTLSAIIRQLSNLGKHAEDIFGELYNEANLLYKRSNMLQDRIDRLSVKVTQLDATRDQETLESFMGQTPYHNTFIADQVILDTGTLPPALKAMRARCDVVPPLGLLDQYRDDGKEALKFYTNPKYFFELWCQEMQKNITDIREKRKGRKRQRGNRTHQSSGPKAIRTRKDVWRLQAGGQDLMPTHPTHEETPSQTPTSEAPTHLMSDGNSSQGSMQDMNHHPQSVPEEYRDHRRPAKPHNRPPPPPQAHEPIPTDHHIVQNGGIHRPARMAPAPPPMQMSQHLPPPPQPQLYDNMDQHYQQFPQPPEQMDMQPNHTPLPPPLPNSIYQNNVHPQVPIPVDTNIPPPPSPPPGIFNTGGFIPQAPTGPIPSNIPAPPPPPPPADQMISKPPSSNPPITNPMSSSPPANTTISPTRRTSTRPTPPRASDGRSDLLRAIESGINLRKVDFNNQEKERTAVPNSVEAILARRIAVELSDSEDGSYSSMEDDDDWGDD